jgi:penicillin-binding protein 2
MSDQAAAAESELLRRQRRNCRSLCGFFLALLLLLLACIAWVQIFQSENFTLQSQQQQTRKLYVPAKRGSICDRHGTRLNYTVPMYTLVIRPDLVRDPRDTRRVTLEKINSAIAELALWLGPDFYRFKPGREQISQHLDKRTPMPIPLWQDLDAHTIARWNSRKHDFPGTELLLSWKRFYDVPEIASQLRGFTRPGEPDDPDMKQYWNANFKEPVGKSGLEYLLNPELRGSGGSEVLLTDVLSYRNTVLESRKAVNGEDLRLTIDLECQRLAEELYAQKGYSGALVVLDASNGEILVLASCPGYDLSANLPDTSRQAQFNRAVGGAYPPGSTIKPFMALYALEKGLLDADTPNNCPGWFELSDKRTIACHQRLGHGNIALTEALAKSCNTFFCALGKRMGAAGWNEFVQCFAFGQKMNTILYRQETAGIAYSPDWVREQRRQAPLWGEDDSAYAGIGQGKWLVSPLQMAVSTGILLTGNWLQAKILLDEPVQLLQSFDWSESNLELIRRGMRQCVYGPGGTGHALRIPGVTVLGKTGTAEVTNQTAHAWSIAAIPADKPRLVGVAIVENGGGGGKIAAPILKEVMELAGR